MGEYRWRGAIVLVVFWRVGLGIAELWKFELVNAGKSTIGRASSTLSLSVTS